MMDIPDWLVFFRRKLPSANSVLVRGSRPVLIDSGFGSDLAATEAWLHEVGVPPERLHLVVNTHYHSDHVGGNNGLQRRYDLPIAAHHHDADLVNRRDPDVCRSVWLDQPVEAYRVDHPLHDGDEIDTGTVLLRVVHAPGHTLGHIVLYAPADGVIISGDLVQKDDVAWINPFNEGGVDAVERTLATLDRLARLPLRLACSGHGPITPEPLASIDAARRRYEKWLADPPRAAWHACKRIFAYALIIYGGLAEADVAPYLLRCPWFRDYGRHYFGLEPAEFIQPLLAEMLRAQAATWQDGRLVALAPHTPPLPDWTGTAGSVYPAWWLPVIPE
jgi:glyoxylase-like metal-dependent hydrolase (beta-lactamase superfamily II)